MEPERWDRITALFEAVRDLSGSARAELLARHPADDRAEVESLLAHADDDTMSGIHDAIAEAARDLLPSSAGVRDGLPAGARLGRYVVLDRLGAGGMGVVYAAWDPELDRKVAVKLLHRHREAYDGDESPLIREARAMARLAHPNVLAIHDVGTLDGRVFVTTEFVDGVTLRRWLVAPRAWPETLRVLIAAGHGLAAAHRAGIVHRDFKPDNVMIDGDGRVRVMDFGLARAGRADAAPAAVAGTPAYMAPEQWSGGALDARTDVFAFCVTAWESFHGERPFAGDTRTEIAQAIAAGRVQEPQLRSRLPRRLLKVLLRGLALDPAGRYPDMGSLLVELDRDPWAKLVRGARIGLTCAVLGALGYAGHLLTRPGTVAVQVTSDGAPIAPSAVHVGPHALAVGGGGARGEVPAGTYRLLVQAPDHAPREVVVEVERGKEVHLDLEVQRERGRIDLEVDPPGATIYVDGVDHGGRLRGLSVATGERRVRVRHPGRFDVERDLPVAVDQVRSGYVALPHGVVWSRLDSGIQRPVVALGDLDGDGRQELLHRGATSVAAVSPWDDRVLWRTTTAPAQPFEHWTGDVDGDALIDVVVVEFTAVGTTRASAWPGARLADPHARPLWTRTGRTRTNPYLIANASALVDVDADGGDDLVTAQVDPDGLVAVSGRTGETLWRTPLPEPFRALLVGPGRLFVVTDVGRHALDLASGAPVWSTPATRRPIDRLYTHRGAGDVGLIVTTLDASAHVLDVEARDARDGALRWTRRQAWRGEQAPDLLVGRRPADLVVIADDDLVGLDVQTGEPRWRIDRPRPAWVFDHGPDPGRALLTIATADGLAVHRLADGALVFAVDLGGPAVTEPAPFDWDADGEPELAIAGQDGAIVMVAGDGAREGALYMPDTAATDLLPLGDVDRDGFDDLSVLGASGPSLVLGPNVLWSRRAQDVLRAAPLVADLDADGDPEIVVVGIFGGARGVHCFDAATGSACWPAEHMPGADIIRAPALVPRADGGHDLLTSGGPVLHRHDGRTGARIGTVPIAGLGYASPLATDLDGDGALEALITPWDDASLLVVDPADLAVRGRIQLPTGAWNPPVVARDGADTLLVLHLLDGELRVVDVASRASRWTRPFGQVPYVAPTVADLDGDGDLELVASQVGEPGDLVCLRLSDGAELWRRPGLGGRSSPVAAVDLDGDGALELLHTSNGDGVLALDRGGATRWRFAPRPGRDPQPLSDGGGLVADLDGDGAPEFVTALRDGVVYVLDARTGALRWQVHAGGRVEAPPAVVDGDGDGRRELVIVGHDRTLRLLRAPAPVRDARALAERGRSPTSTGLPATSAP